ncbi:hypothetical protein Turpa_1671 [Turneriella parva DSM 21527]|uniref:GH18 domain-containing protein n=2 Tax=Turneriella TaxID=338321 RepID=I4B4W2_TURPD|nr:hypothetical protein Turpa_1671 [Turneriella parva DSM 21527]
MRLFLLALTSAFALQCMRRPAHTQRMLYVVPETVPAGYDWRPQNHAVSDIVWTGARLDAQGRLLNTGPALAAMEHYSTPPRKFQTGRKKTTPPQKHLTVKHHLLVALTDASAGAKILSDTKTRSQSIAGLVAFVLRHGQVAGLQLDFEYVSPAYADAYVEYIHLLHSKLGPGFKLSVAVFAPVGMPDAWAAFHKLPELAAESDSLVVMLYDHHRPGTPPGCVSDIGWVAANIDALGALPVEKVWLGAPLYGYRFGQKTVALSKSQFDSIAAQAVETDGCLKKDTPQGPAYYPTESLYKEFDALAATNRYRGIAYWRAGFEK